MAADASLGLGTQWELLTGASPSGLSNRALSGRPRLFGWQLASLSAVLPGQPGETMWPLLIEPLKT